MNTRIAHKITTREALQLRPGYSPTQIDRALQIVCRRPRSWSDFDYAHAVLHGMPPTWADDPVPAHGVRRPHNMNPPRFRHPELWNPERCKRRAIWPDGTPRKPEEEIPF